MKDLNPNMRSKMKIDEERVKAAGIRKVSGKHIDLYSDLGDLNLLKELVIVFDQAVPLWSQYFDIGSQMLRPYRVSGFFIEDRDRFRKAGLMPADLPNFPAGFNRGHEMWVLVQPGDYYNRHFLLHEGTHAFMQWFLRGSGPPWYSEGMAEKLALHSWKNGKLTLNVNPKDKREFEFWGRPKLIREARQTGQLRSIRDVLYVPGSAFRRVQNYAWAWCICDFLCHHPKTRLAFKALSEECHVTSNQFSDNFLKRIDNDLMEIRRDWRLFLNEHDYGVDAGKFHIRSAEENSKGTMFKIVATDTWQGTSITLDEGEEVSIVAKGRFQIAHDGQRPWNSEAAGITIQYYGGQPIGTLLAGIVTSDDPTGLLQPTSIGLKGTFKAPRNGRLCFRINDSPANLNDNDGFLTVAIERR